VHDERGERLGADVGEPELRRGRRDELQALLDPNSGARLRTDWLTTATITSSNSSEARPITSTCPLVIGSYEPGQTAMRLAAGFIAGGC
jgi:hypothetical protein